MPEEKINVDRLYELGCKRGSDNSTNSGIRSTKYNPDAGRGLYRNVTNAPDTAPSNYSSSTEAPPRLMRRYRSNLHVQSDRQLVPPYVQSLPPFASCSQLDRSFLDRNFEETYPPWVRMGYNPYYPTQKVDPAFYNPNMYYHPIPERYDGMQGYPYQQPGRMVNVAQQRISSNEKKTFQKPPYLKQILRDEKAKMFDKSSSKLSTRNQTISSKFEVKKRVDKQGLNSIDLSNMRGKSMPQLKNYVGKSMSSSLRQKDNSDDTRYGFGNQSTSTTTWGAYAQRAPWMKNDFSKHRNKGDSIWNEKKEIEFNNDNNSNKKHQKLS